MRLGNISNHNTGKTLDKGRNTGILREYITTSNLYWGFFELDELRKMPIKEDELDRFTAVKGDLLICEGGEAGRSAIWDKDNSICFQNHIHRVRFFANIRSLYVYFFLRKIYFTGEINKYRKGVGIQSLSGDSLSSILLPLPPLAEQYRIVTEIERLFSVIDIIEENNRSLEQIIRQAKSKVLDLAIHGKLVPQDPNDEPASVLLERIKAEQKTKKQTADNSHYPFVVPKSWVWCRLEDIGNWSAGTTPSRTNSNYYINGTIPWLKTGDLNDDIITSVSEYITELALKECKQLKLNTIGSVAIALYGATIGRCGILNIETTTNQACCVCKPNATIFNKYLFYFLLSHREYFKDKAEGGAQPNISKDKIINTLIPMPSLAEQKRIVNQIESIFKTLDTIQNNMLS